MKTEREPAWPFASAWDEALAASGPATIFMPDPKGLLRADAERTREVGIEQGALPNLGPHHYLATDRATGVVMYLYVTHPALAERQLRADAVRVADAEQAFAAVSGQWARRPGRAAAGPPPGGPGGPSPVAPAPGPPPVGQTGPAPRTPG